MADLAITLASGDYDRTRALKEGRVSVEGCAVDYSVVEPNELFKRNLKSQEFDVSEMSLSTYVAHRAEGKAHYTAIPVFLSRAFSHVAFFVPCNRRGATEKLSKKSTKLPEKGFTATEGCV